MAFWHQNFTRPLWIKARLYMHLFSLDSDDVLLSGSNPNSRDEILRTGSVFRSVCLHLGPIRFDRFESIWIRFGRGPNSCMGLFKIRFIDLELPVSDHVKNNTSPFNADKLKDSCQNLGKIMKNTCPCPNSCMIMTIFQSWTSPRFSRWIMELRRQIMPRIWT